MLTPLAESTDMGMLLGKLVEVAGTYYECRAAALAGRDSGERKGK